MQSWKRSLVQIVHYLSKFWRSEHRGVALIVALLVMLVLVLLALSLVLQSQTEYVIAINENDSLAALSHAEAGLEWTGRKVKEYLSASPQPPDFDDLLNGPNNGDTVDDNLVGFRTISTTLALAITASCSPYAHMVIRPYLW